MKDIKGDKFSREALFDRASLDTEKGTIEIAFSSEEPYERAFGIEVLDHKPQSVKLDRLNGGGAVLVNHDTGDQVGVVESARIDEDGKGRASIRFSRSRRGKEIQNDVEDGIRQLVSVGYKINEYVVTERDGEPDMVRVTDWEPHEVSIVSIPADATVGVGRSDETEKPKVKEMKEDKEAVQEVETPDIGKIQKEAREAEVNRINQIRSMAETHELDELGKEAIDGGWTYEKFNKSALEKIGERNNQARIETKHDGDVDLEKKEHKQYSFFRLMEAMANPQDRAAQNRAAFELDVSDAGIKGFGGNFKARGAYIPESVLSHRLLDASTATDGPELIATDLLAGSFIDVLRNNMALTQSGMRTISGLVGNVDIPRQTSAASMTWISAEDGDATESEPQFDQVSMSPKDAACYTEVTRRLLQQSTPGAEGIVRNDLAVAIALGLDLAGLYGAGASGVPEGIANVTGINAKTLGAADPTYVEMVEIIKLVMEDNALLGSLSWIGDPNGWEALSTTPKQGSGVEGNFIMMDSTVKGYPWRTSTQVTAEDYFFGNWSDLIMGEWGGLELNVDPYTHSLKGRVRYVIFKTVDLVVRHPESFCLANDGV